MTTKTLGEEIREFRAKHKLDQVGFGKGVGYAKSGIQHIERDRRLPSKEGEARIREFMATATEEVIAPLRGPGPGNSPTPYRRGRKLRRIELDRVEVNRSRPDEVDDELCELLRKF